MFKGNWICYGAAMSNPWLQRVLPTIWIANGFSQETLHSLLRSGQHMDVMIMLVA